MEESNEMYAWIILKDGKQIYQSPPVCSQYVAVQGGREDAQEWNAKGENVEYDIIMLV